MKDSTVHKLGGTWGHHIEWLQIGTRIAGHMTPLPKKGDKLEVRMQSGRIKHYKITDVEPCGDPRDMFFATVKEPKRYIDEPSQPATATTRTTPLGREQQ